MKNFYKLSKSVLFAIPFLTAQLVSAQVYEMGSGNSVNPSGISDNGIVSLNNASNNHYIWSTTQGFTLIGSITNDAAFAGTTKISGDGKKVSATVTNPASNQNEMSIYDVATKTWKYLGGIRPNTSTQFLSTAYDISYDGSTVVGLSDINDQGAHGIKWDATNGMKDLGSTVPGRSSRANAINNDKTVVVGWQDIPGGDRTAVRWVNGAQEYIKHTNGDYLGEATAVSSDGKTLVGDYDFKPYVWNETTGFQEISHPDASPVLRGVAAAISGDGKTVIGFFRAYALGVSNEGFIWTKEAGRKTLTEYVTNLGIDTKGIDLQTPLTISKDGKKIAGVGVKNGDESVAFFIDLTSALATQSVESKKLSIYPNPVKNILNINGADRIESLEIYNMVGQKIKTIQPTDNIEVSTLAKGTYILKIVNNNKTQNIKFIKE